MYLNEAWIFIFIFAFINFIKETNFLNIITSIQMGRNVTENF